MNAWPMIERCSLAQWKGYGSDLQHSMEAAWKSPFGDPGSIGVMGHALHILWYVSTDGVPGSPSDFLITVKEDYDPPLLDSEKVYRVPCKHADPQSPPPSADPRFC